MYLFIEAHRSSSVSNLPKISARGADEQCESSSLIAGRRLMEPSSALRSRGLAVP